MFVRLLKQAHTKRENISHKQPTLKEISASSFGSSENSMNRR